MKTISITLDENLLYTVDVVTKNLQMSRSAFMQYALELAIQRQSVKELEVQHRQGYEKQPVSKGEFDIWEDEQVWGEE